MKLPFSYRQTFFNTTLGISVAGHLVLFAATSPWFSASPKFSVRQAPESMEVTIVQIPQKELQKVRKEILTLKDPRESEIQAPKVQDKLVPPKTEKPKVVVLENRGAQAEPRPFPFENPAPVYPEYAREQGWEGVVVLKVYVNQRGEAQEVRVERSSGYEILDEAALKTVRAWKFQPARLGLTSFSSWIRIPVRFVLKT